MPKRKRTHVRKSDSLPERKQKKTKHICILIELLLPPRTWLAPLTPHLPTFFSCSFFGPRFLCFGLSREDGELLEVLVWEKVDPTSGLRRLKGRALRDGAVGWASIESNAGTVHLTMV